MAYDARELANFLLDYADERGEKITKLAMQKVVYFSHGWHLAVHDEPLVQNHFEAWEHGPVVKVLYDSFKGEERHVITGRAHRFYPATNEWKLAVPNIEPGHQAFVATIYESYSQYHAFELSMMTHESGSPWDQIWNAPKNTATLGLRISNDKIRAYFRARASDLAKVDRGGSDSKSSTKFWSQFEVRDIGKRLDSE